MNKPEKKEKCRHKWAIAQQDFSVQPAVYIYWCQKCPAKQYVFVSTEGEVNKQIVFAWEKRIRGEG